MSEINPYAAPQYQDADDQNLVAKRCGVWRHGKLLVIHKEAAPPARCVLCNAPASRRLTFKLRWNDPSYFLRSPLLEKNAKLKLGLCNRHRRRRLIVRAVCGLFVALGASLGIVGTTHGVVHWSDPWPLLFIASSFIPAILAAVAYDFTLAMSLKVQRIDREYIWLKGAAPAFLADLPPFED